MNNLHSVSNSQTMNWNIGNAGGPEPSAAASSAAAAAAAAFSRAAAEGAAAGAPPSAISGAAAGSAGAAGSLTGHSITNALTMKKLPLNNSFFQEEQLEAVHIQWFLTDPRVPASIRTELLEIMQTGIENYCTHSEIEAQMMLAIFRHRPDEVRWYQTCLHVAQKAKMERYGSLPFLTKESTLSQEGMAHFNEEKFPRRLSILSVPIYRRLDPEILMTKTHEEIIYICKMMAARKLMNQRSLDPREAKLAETKLTLASRTAMLLNAVKRNDARITDEIVCKVWKIKLSSICAFTIYDFAKIVTGIEMKKEENGKRLAVIHCKEMDHAIPFNETIQVIVFGPTWRYTQYSSSLSRQVCYFWFLSSDYVNFGTLHSRNNMEDQSLWLQHHSFPSFRIINLQNQPSVSPLAGFTANEVNELISGLQLYQDSEDTLLAKLDISKTAGKMQCLFNARTTQYYNTNRAPHVILYGVWGFMENVQSVDGQCDDVRIVRSIPSNAIIDPLIKTLPCYPRWPDGALYTEADLREDLAEGYNWKFSCEGRTFFENNKHKYIDDFNFMIRFKEKEATVHLQDPKINAPASFRRSFTPIKDRETKLRLLHHLITGDTHLKAPPTTENFALFDQTKLRFMFSIRRESDIRWEIHSTEHGDIQGTASVAITFFNKRGQINFSVSSIAVVDASNNIKSVILKEIGEDSSFFPQGTREHFLTACIVFREPSPSRSVCLVAKLTEQPYYVFDERVKGEFERYKNNYSVKVLAAMNPQVSGINSDLAKIIASYAAVGYRDLTDPPLYTAS